MTINQVVLSHGRVRHDITIDVVNSDGAPQTISAVTVHHDKTISWSIFGQRGPDVARQMAKALLKAAEIAER